MTCRGCSKCSKCNGSIKHKKCKPVKKTCEKKLVPFVPLSAKSEDCTSSKLVDIKDHPCAEHCYDFECNLVDSCGDVDGVFNGSINGVNFAGSSGGVTNLGKFVCFTTTNERKIALNAINVNPTGFAISLWFNANDVTGVDARFFSKTGAVAGQSHHIQSHVVSAQLSDQKLKFRLKLGDDPNEGTTQWVTDDLISDSMWYHVVFWYNGCDVKIYLNGDEEPIEETDIGAGTNKARAFASFKGQPVFQGPQPSAAGSQPTNVGEFSPENEGGFREFDGCMDQLIIWENALSQKMIDDLYNSGDGQTKVSLDKVASCASFTLAKCGKSCFLTMFKQVLCLKTCFVDDKLCNVLCNGCSLLSLSIGDVFLLKNIKLSEWPGSLDVLEIKTVDDETFYSLRLCLNAKELYCNPIKINDKKTVKLTVTGGGFIETPLKPFSITGFCHSKRGCNSC